MLVEEPHVVELPTVGVLLQHPQFVADAGYLRRVAAVRVEQILVERDPGGVGPDPHGPVFAVRSVGKDYRRLVAEHPLHEGPYVVPAVLQEEAREGREVGWAPALRADPADV